MYTDQQIQDIQKLKCVIKCSKTNIAYTSEFKVEAVKKYHQEGYTPAMIFREAGFDLDVIGRNKPKICLQHWRRIFHTRGEKGLLTNNKGHGGRKPSKPKTVEEQIKFLEAKVAYLDAENDFLAKLRGIQRREFSNHLKSLKS